MMRSRVLFSLVCLALAPGLLHGGTGRRPPNIVVLLADDLGYADLGVHGAKDIATPHIDALARHGVRCTSGYVSAPYCSPTRAGLLTGRYQQRFGHEFNPVLLRLGGQGQGLPLDQRTLADWLRAAGYATGLIGKWHLGEEDAYHPQQRGFQEFFGFLAGAHSYVEAEDKNMGPLLRGKEKVALDGYLTDVLSKEAVAFVERHKDRPFFLYLAFNAVHTPLQAPAATLQAFADQTDPTRRTYLAMLKKLDDAIGAVLTRLRELNLEEETLIFFLSDNGGPTTKFAPNGARNFPLRGSKGDTWEGGIRVPFIVQWQGRLPGGTTYPQPVISLDIAATALAAAGTRTPEGTLDGVNLLPLVQAKDAAPPQRALYWRFGTQMAIRQGDWVLVRPSMGKGEYEAIAAQPLLFDLSRDVGQQHDLAAAQPERVRQMQREWERWNAGLAAPHWPATLRGAPFKMP
jgi:arylsulfatase A-like enzyme